MFKPKIIAGLLALGLSGLAAAQTAPQTAAWTVRPEWVQAHEDYLAGDALRGRGSGTPDEAKAADYVAAQFKGFGLVPAPGMDGYLQTARIVRVRLSGPPSLTVDGAPVADPMLLFGSGEGGEGKLTVFAGADPAALPAGGVVIATAPEASKLPFIRGAAASRVGVLILRESDVTADLHDRFGGKPRMPSYLEGDTPTRAPAVVVLPKAAFDALAARGGAQVALKLAVLQEASVTTNAIGYLPGTDPKAGVVLYTAHLDHLGVRPDGTIMHGANDDASGTTAVIEIAHALAAGARPRRGVLFVCYGSEEAGEWGSNYFGKHPPVPLADVVANIEFEMIGAQDPKLPAGHMMMTGFERSNLGEALAQHGALVSGDPYPEQHFFQRSDNYQLALKGVVAHTLSGWAVVPTYHQPTDTVANLDIAFMTRAIQSLIEPARWLANSDFKPEWKPGGRPAE